MRIQFASFLPDSSLITTWSKGTSHTNPKRERGMPQVSWGAALAPSLTLRVGMEGDSSRGAGSEQAGYSGGVQREVSKNARLLHCRRRRGWPRDFDRYHGPHDAPTKISAWPVLLVPGQFCFTLRCLRFLLFKAGLHRAGQA